ncbi:hypothetical protein F442_04560 [Phytophthora nicotianae P10297]|uniref:Uncharacterized protein n=2 Tax=Phytophthora nicotianae TaxID=4792 RepID=W2QHZ8_PHYN3|nr:hypothetical protein PPTG_22411 [Phytophthora nicotianae INRA-310]ETN12778.1 hypothetical protein PPTG_22411 [Phytophthora nicotianae INRA-310]ETP50032.1 hypothetical protein F442_04560 [Phytophthora nicotianae P10297]
MIKMYPNTEFVLRQIAGNSKKDNSSRSRRSSRHGCAPLPASLFAWQINLLAQGGRIVVVAASTSQSARQIARVVRTSKCLGCMCVVRHDSGRPKVVVLNPRRLDFSVRAYLGSLATAMPVIPLSIYLQLSIDSHGHRDDGQLRLRRP